MTAQRLLGIPALVAFMLVASCATTRTSPRTTLKPTDGPRAHIYASYDGGLTHRTLRASFTVDQNAYVMVGHLSGKGQIEILYPNNALASGRVQGRKTHQVRRVSALYDGVPQLFSYATRAVRNNGARMDSYDGRGNGFLFIIASQYPLDFDGLSTDGFWDDFEVEGYSWSSDPRYAIRDLAQYVTRGLPYSLDYADSFGTNAYTSYASMQMDCGILSGAFGDNLSSALGLWGLGGAFLPSMGWWGGGGFLIPLSNWMQRSYGSRSNGYSPCSVGYRPWSLAMSGRPADFPFGRNPWANAPGKPATPNSPPAPTVLGWRTPGLRSGSESGAAVSLMRPRFGSRPTTTAATASWMPPVPRQHEPEQYRPGRPSSSAPRNYDGPSRSPRYDPPSATNGRFDAPRSAPVYQQPRFSPTPTPAAATPASPPPTMSPRVEAASAGKPREP